VRDAATGAGTLVLLPSSTASTWDLLTGRTGTDVTPLDTALQHVLTTSDVGRVAFAGFSDGASYALSLGLANGDLAEAVLAFSPGFVSPPSLVGRPRCWVAHGTADTVLPVDRCGRRVVALLERQARPVHYEEFDGGHVVRPDHLDAALRWWLEA
jgi:predicted esterase